MFAIWLWFLLANQPESVVLSEPGDDFIGHINPNIDSGLVRHDRLYLRDEGQDKVLIYNLDGSFRKSFPPKGDGPGEIKKLSAFDVGKKSIVVVDQFNPACYSLFDLEGNFEKVVRLPPGELIEFATTPIIYGVWLLHASHHGHRINGKRIVVRDLASGQVLRSFEEPMPAVSQRIGWLRPRVWKARLWVPNPFSREIDVVDPEKGIQQTITLPYAGAEPFDRNLLEQQLRQGKAMEATKYMVNRCRLNWFFWVFDDALVTWERASDRVPHLRIYSHQGQLIKQVSLDEKTPLGQAGRPIAATENALLFLSESDDDPTPTIATIPLESL